MMYTSDGTAVTADTPMRQYKNNGRIHSFPKRIIGTNTQGHQWSLLTPFLVDTWLTFGWRSRGGAGPRKEHTPPVKGFSRPQESESKQKVPLSSRCSRETKRH